MVGVLLIAAPVLAGPNTVNGAFIGAGSGALIGQALGRNTEATLAGTFIGGILGAAIGSDMDRDRRVRSEVVYTTHRRPESVDYVIVDRYQRDEWYDETCREVDLVARVDGRREKIKATACLDEDGRWVIEQPDRINVTRKVIIERPVETVTKVIIKSRPSRVYYRDSRWRRHDTHRYQRPVWW
jgi:uncharacterized protein YcfJ